MGQLIKMPRYGANMEEGTLASLDVSEGESVTEGQVLFEIEIEKLTNEVEAPADGVIRKLFCEEGETLPCGAPLAVLADAQEDIGDLLAEAGRMEGEEPSEPAAPPAAAAAPEPASPPEQPAPPEAKGEGFPGEVPGLRITPKALELAEEWNMDYRDIKGTGLLGAVTRKDLRARRAAGAQSPQREEPAAPAAPEIGSGKGPGMSPARKATARHMMDSLSRTAQTSITMDADMTDLVEAYHIQKNNYAALGVKLSYTALLAKGVSRALDRHPLIRTVMDGPDSMKTLENGDIGIAVDTGAGLTVPVLRGVNRKSLPVLCRDLSELVDRVKSKTLTADQTAGGVFTISNLGMEGVRYFTPILNLPQSAILGAGSLVQQPVVIDGGLHIRWIMALSLTFDHRIIDGVPAARFLKDVCRELASSLLLEAPA